MTTEPDDVLSTLVCTHVGEGPADWNVDPAVVFVDGLCRNAGLVGAHLSGCSGVLVIGCTRGPSRGATQRELSKAGLDLGALYHQKIRGPVSTPELVGLVRGGVARLVNQPPGILTSWRPDSGQGMSRRNLLRIEPTEKVPVPSVDTERCAHTEGCRKCVDSCPASAILIGTSGAEIDPTSCKSCGLCQTVCPTGAIVDHTTTFSGVRAQLEALLVNANDDDSGRYGVSFVCRHASAVSLEDGWSPIQVTSLGIITVPWLLAPLLIGGVPVSVPECGLCESLTPLDTRIELAVEIATAGGWDGGVISRQGPCPPPDSRVLTQQPATDRLADGVAIIAAIAGSSSAVLRQEHPDSPVGQIAIGDACTGSLLCASVCPTDALRFEDSSGHVDVTFDAALCDACGHCLDVCPEIEQGSITLTRIVDFAALRMGRQTLRRHDKATCSSCGEPREATRMLTRVAELLHAGDDEAITDGLAICDDCRAESVVAFGRSVLRPRGTADPWS